MHIFDNFNLSMVELYIFGIYVDLLPNNFIGLPHGRLRFWAGLVFIYFLTAFRDLHSLIRVIIFLFLVVLLTMKKLGCSVIWIFGSGGTSQFYFVDWILFHSDSAITNTRVNWWYFWWIFWRLWCKILTNEGILQFGFDGSESIAWHLIWNCDIL